jgi:hypothetical protein
MLIAIFAGNGRWFEHLGATVYADSRANTVLHSMLHEAGDNPRTPHGSILYSPNIYNNLYHRLDRIDIGLDDVSRPDAVIDDRESNTQKRQLAGSTGYHARNGNTSLACLIIGYVVLVEWIALYST